MRVILQGLSFARFSCFRSKISPWSPEAMANRLNRREHRAPHRPTCSRTAGWLSTRASPAYRDGAARLRVARIFAEFAPRADAWSVCDDLPLCARRRRPPRTAGSCPFGISLLKLAWLQRKQSEEPEKESKERGRPRPEGCSLRERITMR